MSGCRPWKIYENCFIWKIWSVAMSSGYKPAVRNFSWFFSRMDVTRGVFWGKELYTEVEECCHQYCCHPMKLFEGHMYLCPCSLDWSGHVYTGWFHKPQRQNYCISFKVDDINRSKASQIYPTSSKDTHYYVIVRALEMAFKNSTFSVFYKKNLKKSPRFRYFRFKKHLQIQNKHVQTLQ